MDKFIIDRQFGGAIWVNVQKGIVTKCYGEAEKFNAEMEKRYKSKGIAFLKENFEAVMKPAYYDVKSVAIINELQKLASIESNLRVVGNLMSSTSTPKDHKERLKIAYSDLLSKRIKQERKLKAIRKRIQTVHNYPHEV
jgi:hypothetical protein